MSHSRSSRFDGIISVREHQKKQTTKELTLLTRQKLIEEQRLSSLHVEQTTAIRESFRNTRSKAGDVQANGAFLHRLAEDLEEQRHTVERAEGLEKKKRAELLERVKAQTVIERLQERIREEERKESDKKEQNLLDTLGQRSSGTSV